MSNGAFGSNFGPGSSKTPNPFGNLPQKASSTPPLARSPSRSPTWGTGQNFFYRDYDAQIDEGPPTVIPFTASSNFSTAFPARASQNHDIRSTRSPPLYADEEKLRNSRSIRISRAGFLPKGDNHLAPDLNQSSSLSFQRNSYSDEAQLSALHSPMSGEQLRPSSNFITPPTQPVISPVQAPANNDPRRRFPVQYADLQVSKRSRSPNFPSRNNGSSEDSVVALQNSQRPSTSPPKMRLSNHLLPPGSQSHQQPSTSGYLNNGQAIANKPTSSPVSKKSKLPSSTTHQAFQETPNSLEEESNRELQAKAKRLMRFKNELSFGTESDLSSKTQKVPAKKHHPVAMEKKRLHGEDAADVMGDSFNANDHLPDYEDLGSSGIIVGLCLDMCPESERGERERKGDLDQFERLDGDRNQTSKSLAVKKYTRTAEREAEVIRPMPVLQKTMDYLLNLLNQPYDDRFLGLYNFLWDRMRAVRMDLRMQHIFDIGAIKMLEQMIRLHIVAMHELCEYTKGEGFSVGFDAHLNIEQMNKTSVELFQLYDDHRKKGTNVDSEKEFRGYYALLKLDKHPGYKVEPAELSLDLAKMTQDIRQTPEVMFARDVARSCRTCNFIAFFNLARKASYLEACLMHAHFSKLRTQALAALHSGLQNNQGIPVADIAEWLGMEGENIEDLLEYHGFSIKEFEVPYMVKEGAFLNADNDYPVKCSKLVNAKKSGLIYGDVSYPSLAKVSPAGEIKQLNMITVVKQKPIRVQSIEVDNGFRENDEDMLDYVQSPRDVMQDTQTPETVFTPRRVAYGDQPSPASPRVSVPSTFNDSPGSQRNKVGSEGKYKYDTLFRNSFGRNAQVELEGTPLQKPYKVGEANVPVHLAYTVSVISVPQDPTVEELGEEYVDHTEEEMVNEVETTSYDQEVAEAKLKLILRIWKRLTRKKRELHEQKQLAATAALNSLSLGPPIWHSDTQSRSSGDFDIERVMTKRYEIREKSLSRLNVSEVVATELSAKNPDAQCLCWKVLLLTQDKPCSDNLGKRKKISHIDAGSWLISKLLPARCKDDNTGDLPVSSPGVAIWKKWLPSQDDAICCLTIIKDVESENLKDSVAGASALVFPVSDCIPWELQRNQLHNVLMALPLASSLPLLVVTGLCEDDLDGSFIVERLQLHDIEKSRICSSSVISLKNHQMDRFNGFYSDERLREGLQWLASKSPSQPLLHRMKTRELVNLHLNSLLETLDDVDVHKLGPNICISAFNEALDQSLLKVSAAVSANPNSWPCPEICLLEESSDECRAVSRYLPSVAWNAAARIEPLFRAVSDFKLPYLDDDIRWLTRGSITVNDIEKLRSQLEGCLIRYLTESSQMALPLATKEASIMIQKFTKLELHNSAYHIIPKWIMIFQRIFRWRLMELSNDQISSVYMLARDVVSMSTTSGVLPKVEWFTPFPYLVEPSFDEMAATGYNPLTPENYDVNCGALQPYSEPYASDSYENPELFTEAPMEEEDGRNDELSSLMAPKHDVIITDDESSDAGEVSLAAKNASAAADRLSELLERCNFVQNMIQDKLSIYL